MARQRKKTESQQKTEQGKISKRSFVDALTKVKPGLANKEIIEQSTHFVFDNDRIWTYNDQIYICELFESGLSGAVKAEQFYKLLTKFPDEDIVVTSEAGKINLTVGENIRSTIKIDPNVKIEPIQVPGINSQKWETLPENFHEAIAFSAFSASKNLIRPELCSLYVVDKYVIGCDTFRGTKYDLSSKMNNEFLLPAKAAIELAKYNPHKVFVDDGWLHFVNKEKTTFSCRAVVGIEYPPQIWDFFKIEGEEIVLPGDFLEAVDRAHVLLTDSFDLDKVVTLTMADNEVICFGSGDYGEIYEKAKIEYNGEKLEIKVHPVLLKEILKHLQNVVIGDRLLFQGENFCHGVCLSS